MRVLVIAAHPDDEVLGCGGTMARLAAEGHEVQVAILGEGWSSRCAHREDADPLLMKELTDTSQKAAAVLGAQCVLHGGLPDNRFDTVALLDVVKLIENLIVAAEPEHIYTHHGGDLNIDHVVTHRAVLTATRPTGRRVVKTLYAFEVPSATEWSFGGFRPVFNPTVFCDIEATLTVKITAMQAYESEARAFPHPRSPEALTALARWRGSAAGLRAAEAFECMRDIR